MKRLCIILLMSNLSCRAVDLPRDIAQGFKQSRLVDGAGLSVHGADRDTFVSYINKNWRTLLENVDLIPLSEAGSDSERDGRNYSLYIVAAACEHLKPEEYVEFLDNWTSLYEQDVVPLEVIEQTVRGEEEKEYFVAVNWEEPRIQKILQRIIAKTPRTKVATYENFVELSEGRGASSYNTNRENGSRLPQILPGIKLRQPEAGFMRKVGDAVRSSHALEDPSKSAPENKDSFGAFGPSNAEWPVWIGGIAVLTTGMVLILKRKGSH